MIKTIETERLFIRPLEEDDSPFFYKLLNSPSWLEYIGNRNIQTENEAKKYIQKIIEDPNYNCNVFINKETLELMGVVTFIYRETQQFPDIGYAMLSKFEKKGYAFEAVKRYLEEIRAQRITKRVIAITNSKNINSIKLLERLGMVLDHSFSEEETLFLVYSIIGEESK